MRFGSPVTGRTATLNLIESRQSFTETQDFEGSAHGLLRHTLDQYPCGGKLVQVDGVSHAGVDAEIYGRPLTGENVPGDLESFQRDMWIDVAASAEDRSSLQPTGIVLWI